jgi:RNA polymerase-binding transcription factor DksA
VTGAAGGSRGLARHLPALREELEKQRVFRSEQLAHLVAHTEDRMSLAGYGPRADGETTRALDEVRALVVAGARKALADVDLALARMSAGNYGRCRACGADIPLAVLMAIPRTTLCRNCHPSAAEPVAVRPVGHVEDRRHLDGHEGEGNDQADPGQQQRQCFPHQPVLPP